MYLDYFGLNEPPFKITPVTDFFFPGANRAEILDALLYAISESEGIIKITGEVGSGKTMLCCMLLERFSDKIEAVYLANPSLSREEMLYAIADGLNLNLEGQRVNVILQTLQNHLETRIADGKRVVILVDEAHAMPLETLEELRLLYNLQVGDHKLMHIVLFGQPELNDKLNQPNMRQLKDRIIHHFSMLPLSHNIIESYLLFRMRAAGYRGPSPFTAPAATLIGKASQGLMRRVNILADKALLSAFVEDTHAVKIRHVQAAIRDSELTPYAKNWWEPKITPAVAILLLSITFIVAGSGWLLGSLSASNAKQTETKKIQTLPANPPVPSNITPAAEMSPLPPAIPALQATDAVQTISSSPVTPASQTDKVIQITPAVPAKTAEGEAKKVMMAQRLEATQAMLAKLQAGSASIQLYYTNNVQPSHIEKFLENADKLGALHKIYVLPIKINGRKGLRILYGIYANSEEARSGITKLPKSYLNAYAPAIYLLDPLPGT
jgi:MSHA biogenesis protein MshM